MSPSPKAAIRFLFTVLLSLRFVSATVTAQPIAAPLPNPFEDLQKLTADDQAGDDRFGAAVALAGGILSVGARFDDDACISDPTCDSGSAYIFQDRGGEWMQIDKVTAKDGTRGDLFGSAVAIEPQTLFIGAPSNNSGQIGAGAVYVFSRDRDGPGAWGEEDKLVAGDTTLRDRFGSSLSLSGNTLVVGAPHDDDDGDNSGSAYIFERDNAGEWVEVKKLVASDAAAGHQFGEVVAIDRDTVVVSASRNMSAGNSSGAVYIFERNEDGMNQWGEVKMLSAMDISQGARFGVSVAIDADTVFVGADSDAAPAFGSGSAYIFARDQSGPGQWGEVQKLLPADAEAEDRFGTAVAVKGDVAVVSAERSDDFGESSGSAYLFERADGGPEAWVEVTKFLPSDNAFGDNFGASVTMNSTALLIGADQDSNIAAASGSAYIFENPLAAIFSDGFETGNTSSWSSTTK